MTDNTHFNEEGRDKLISGIRKCSISVGGTMGTGGHNALIECLENPGHFSTNDGITILENMHLADPLEDMGRKILLEAVSRANKQSGDGSSTTTVLTASIIEEGIKHLKDHSPMEIKKSLEDCVSLIEESINKQKREITVDTVSQVASISAEDPAIGSMIQDIYQQIGKDGIIHWDISKTGEDYYSIGKGITVDMAKLASPYMADLNETSGQFQNITRIKNPNILITKQKITTAGEFDSLFKALFDKEIKEVVVFCDDYEPNIISDLIKTRAIRGFRTYLIKMPTLWKDWWYEDLAKATGATVIDPQAGLFFKNMTLAHLGTVENITVDKENTYLDGIKYIQGHVDYLLEEGTDEGALRASRLNTKTARYFVGAASDSALSYRRLKVEDAIGASYQALQNGVVAGGGVALLNASKGLRNTVGGNLLKKALLAPMTQILKNGQVEIDLSKDVNANKWWRKGNMGIPYTVWRTLWMFLTFHSPLRFERVRKIASEKTDISYPHKDKDNWVRIMDHVHGEKASIGGRIGFDTRTKKSVDMFEAGIIDPANVVLNAARNAISVAASVLTCPVIITVPRQDVADQLIQAIMAKGMPQR